MKKNPDHTSQKPPIVFPYGGAKVGENGEKNCGNWKENGLETFPGDLNKT
jgi:hypothetical protein